MHEVERCTETYRVVAQAGLEKKGQLQLVHFVDNGLTKTGRWKPTKMTVCMSDLPWRSLY